MDTASNRALLQLAELAIENGWHPGEVANVMQTAVGPVSAKAVAFTHTATATASSAMVMGLFKRRA